MYEYKILGASSLEPEVCNHYTMRAIKARYEREVRIAKMFWEARKELRNYLKLHDVEGVGEYEDKYDCDYEDDPKLDKLFTQYYTLVKSTEQEKNHV